MVDHKKKVVRVVQDLCKNCTRNITHRDLAQTNYLCPPIKNCHIRIENKNS